MKKLNTREYILEIYGSKNTYRAATREFVLNGVAYPNNIVSVSKGADRIDPVSFESSITEISFKIATGEEGVPSGGGRVVITEVHPVYMTPNNLSGTDLSVSQKRDDTIIQYEGRIGTIVNEGRHAYTLTVTFNRGELFAGTDLSTLDRNTFAKYLTFSPVVTETQDFIPIADLNEDSAKPLGPIMGIERGANKYVYYPEDDPNGPVVPWNWPGKSVKKGYIGAKSTPKDEVMQVFIPKKYVDAFLFQTKEPEVGLSELDATKYNREQLRYHYSKRTHPLGEVVRVKDRIVNGVQVISDIHYRAPEGTYMLMYNSEAPASFDKEVKDEESDLPLTEAEQIIRFVTSESRAGKISHLAYKVNDFYLTHQGIQVTKAYTSSRPVEDIQNTMAPTGATQNYIELTYVDSYYMFELSERHDLRDTHAFRLLNKESAKPNEGASPTYSEENMFLQSFSSIGTLEERTKLFDEQWVKKWDDNQAGEIEFGKWFAALAQGVTVVKRAEVDAGSIDNIDAEVLLGTRIDVISTDRKKNSSIQVLDKDSGTVFNKEYTFQSLFEVADGRFGFIEGVESKGSKWELTFNTTRQWQDATSEPPVPNALFVDSESFGAIETVLAVINPLPENSPSEGEVVPLVYGYVEKFPAMQAISRKSNFGDIDSAGDDVYLLCSNPLSRKDGNGITVYWGLDEFASGSGTMTAPSSEVTTFQSGLDKAKKYWISNPFPSVEKIPHKIMKPGNLEDLIYGATEHHALPDPVIEYEITPHPFHYSMQIEDNHGVAHSAVKLRGDEYIPELGEMDPRHSIRFGLGSSKIYCSFVGMPDDIYGTITGIPNAPIVNPAHILHHFVRYYGNINSPSQIDVSSFDYCYSKTRDLNCSFYINDETFNADEALSEMTKCSFVFLSYHRGIYKAKHFSLKTNVNASYVIREDDVTAVESEAFFEGITDYTFNYSYSFPTGKFSKKIKMNSENNSELAKARAYSGSGKSTEISFEFLFDDASVRRLIPQYIDLMSGYRTKIAVTLMSNKNAAEIEVCDIIEVNTSRGYDYVRDREGFHQEKFIVYEIEERDRGDSILLKAIQLQSRNNLKKQPRVRDRMILGKVNARPPIEWNGDYLELPNLVAFFDPTNGLYSSSGGGNPSQEGEEVDVWKDSTGNHEIYLEYGAGEIREGRMVSIGQNPLGFSNSSAFGNIQEVMTQTDVIDGVIAFGSPAYAIGFGKGGEHTPLVGILGMDGEGDPILETPISSDISSAVRLDNSFRVYSPDGMEGEESHSQPLSPVEMMIAYTTPYHPAPPILLFSEPLPEGLREQVLVKLKEDFAWDSPLKLKQDIWLDPTDIATLFQDAAGTIPVTSVGDPVGLWKNKGTLGSDGDATQPVSAKRPVWTDAGVLDMPAGSWLRTSYVATTPFEVFVIARQKVRQGNGWASVIHSGLFGRSKPGVDNNFALRVKDQWAMQTSMGNVAIGLIGWGRVDQMQILNGRVSSSETAISYAGHTAVGVGITITSDGAGAVVVGSTYHDFEVMDVLIFERILTGPERDQLISWLEAQHD